MEAKFSSEISVEFQWTIRPSKDLKSGVVTIEKYTTPFNWSTLGFKFYFILISITIESLKPEMQKLFVIVFIYVWKYFLHFKHFKP
jgi:hypothetical protein